MGPSAPEAGEDEVKAKTRLTTLDQLERVCFSVVPTRGNTECSSSERLRKKAPR